MALSTQRAHRGAHGGGLLLGLGDELAVEDAVREVRHDGERDHHAHHDDAGEAPVDAPEVVLLEHLLAGARRAWRAGRRGRRWRRAATSRRWPMAPSKARARRRRRLGCGPRGGSPRPRACAGRARSAGSRRSSASGATSGDADERGDRRRAGSRAPRLAAARSTSSRE